jgi:rhodanese-related sulfurtransferase
MEKELTLETAKNIVNDSEKKFVWVGAEMHFDAAKKALDLAEDKIMCINPRELVDMEEHAKKFNGNVFVCYHGNTSLAVVNYLGKLNIEAYSLKGGITSIVGEIF